MAKNTIEKLVIEGNTVDEVLTNAKSVLVEEQYELLLEAYDIVYSVVSESENRHTADYYRALYIEDMFGFEDIEVVVAQLAAEMARCRYAEEHRQENAEQS